MSEKYKSINKFRAKNKAQGGSAASGRKPKFKSGNGLGLDGKPSLTSTPF